MKALSVLRATAARLNPPIRGPIRGAGLIRRPLGRPLSSPATRRIETRKSYGLGLSLTAILVGVRVCVTLPVNLAYTRLK